jgi:hypothetical protein
MNRTSPHDHPPRQALHHLLRAFEPLREHGKLLDPASHLSRRRQPALPRHHHASPNAQSAMQDAPLGLFLLRLRELQNAEDEVARRRAEQAVLTLAPSLKRAGVFKLIGIAHPAIAAMVRDHLAEVAGSHTRRCA